MSKISVETKIETGLEELVQVMPKGLITIPNKIRKLLGFDAKKRAFLRVIPLKRGFYAEPVEIVPASQFRLYTDSEIKKFLEKDKISPSLAKKVGQKVHWSKSNGEQKR